MDMTSLVIGALIGVWITWLLLFMTGGTEVPFGRRRHLYAESGEPTDDEHVNCNLRTSDETHDECGGIMLEVDLVRDKRTKWSLLGKDIRLQTAAVGWFCQACDKFVPEEDFEKGRTAAEVQRLQTEVEETVRKALSFISKGSVPGNDKE